MSDHPYPAFHFSVDFGGAGAGFCEVVGLSHDRSVTLYRNGDEMNRRALVGPVRPGPITLRRGIVDSVELHRWFESGEPRDVTVSLLDEEQRPARTWTLHRCVPVESRGPSLGSLRNEVAIEALTLQPEAVAIE